MDVATVGDFIEWAKYFFEILKKLFEIISGNKDDEDTTQAAE